MKSFVLEKTRYILTNSWFGLLLPAGVHQLLSSERQAIPAEKTPSAYRLHPAESKIVRNPGSRNKP